MSLDVLSLLHGGAAVQLAAAPQSAGLRRVVTEGPAALALAPPVIEVTPAGVSFPFDWGTAPADTDRVDLAPVPLRVLADPATDFAGYPLGELVSRAAGGGLVVNVPAARRVRALTLTDLTCDGTTFRNEGQLRAAGRRLTVSSPDPRGGWATPAVAVPPVDARGQVPATLTGASFSGSVLKLPDLPGPLRVAVVEGDTPDAFGGHQVSVGTVTGWAAPTPVDLTLSGPDGAVVWSFPGPLPPGASQAADVTVAVAAALDRLRQAGRALAGALTLTSRFPCRVAFGVGPVHGDLVRVLRGTTSVVLAGEPVTIPVTPPLGQAAPTSVVADVAVTYDGRRLADISDPLPAAGSVSGVVAGSEPVLRLLPPQALRGERVARVGLIGCCPGATALLVRLVPAPAAGGAPSPAPGAGAGPAGPALGRPGTAQVPAGTDVGVVWVDLPEPVLVDQPVAVEVSASSGTLQWVVGPDPLVRIVVLDPDPGGRPVVLGGRTLLTVAALRLRTMRAALPAGSFAGPGPPSLASALFCTVEITDAELRHSRGAT